MATSYGTFGSGQAGYTGAFQRKPAKKPDVRSGAASAPHPAAMAPKPAAAKPAPVSQTLAQVANQRVQQQIGPQVAAQNQFNAQQNATIQSFAQALLGKLQPIAGQVGQGYDQAIQQTGALSSQAAQFLQNANPTGQVADLLKSINAPQSQQDQIAGQLGQTFGGGAGVLAFTGGAIPGGQLAADKAASMGEAAQLPGLAALKGQQDLASALWQQGQDRRTLEATRPALYQAAAQDIRTNNAARAKFGQTAAQNQATNAYHAATAKEKAYEYDTSTRLKAQQFGVTTQQKADQFAATQQSKKAAADFLTWYKTQGLNLDEAKVNEKAKEFGVTAAQKQQAIGQRGQQIGIQQQNANTSAVRANNAAEAATARQANADARLKLAQQKQAATAKQQKATGGLSASSWRTLVSDATKQAQKLATTTPARTHYEQGQPSPVPGTGKKAATYQKALGQIVALAPPGVNPTTWHKKAMEIVNAQYEEGENGRPYSRSTARSAATEGAKAAFQAGIPFTQALKTAKASGKYPPDILEAALRKVYYGGRFSPVTGSPHFGQQAQSGG